MCFLYSGTKVSIIHCMPIKTAKISSGDTTKWWHQSTIGTLTHWEWKYEIAWPLTEEIRQCLEKLNTLTRRSWQPCSVVLLKRDLKTDLHKTCSLVLTAAFFTTAKTWKGPDYPWARECINELWCIQTIEYYSLLKGNELSSHKNTHKSLRCITKQKNPAGEGVLELERGSNG